MTDTKFFHISDILSFYVGLAMLSEREEMTMPDGSVRPAYNLEAGGILAVAEHVIGAEIPRNKYTAQQFNGEALMEVVHDVRAVLVYQLPWLVEYPERLRDELRGNISAIELFVRRAMNTHGAWHKLTSDKYIHPSWVSEPCVDDHAYTSLS